MDPLDEFATRYVEMCVRKWIEKRLPVAPLAAAMTAWGLNAASHGATPEHIAAGLERVADALRDLEPGDVPHH